MALSANSFCSGVTSPGSPRAFPAAYSLSRSGVIVALLHSSAFVLVANDTKPDQKTYAGQSHPADWHHLSPMRCAQIHRLRSLNYGRSWSARSAKIVIHALRCTPVASAPSTTVGEDSNFALIQPSGDLARSPVREHCILGIDGRASPTDQRHETDRPQKNRRLCSEVGHSQLLQVAVDTCAQLWFTD